MIKAYLWELILNIKKRLTKIKIVPDAVKKIVVFTHGGIGNFILLVPSLYSIKKHFKNSHITIISPSKINISLVKNTSIADNIIGYDYNRFSKRECQKFFKKQKISSFDLGFSFATSKASYCLKIIKTKIRIGYDYGFNKSKTNQSYLTVWKKLNHKEHEADQYFSLLNLLQIPLYKKKYMINMTPVLKYDSFFKTKNPVIGIHPGCSRGLEQKQWPLFRFLQVAEKLNKKHKAKTIFFGGKEDRLFSKKIPDKKYLLNLINKVSLTETAYLISKCDLFISNDSGLMHLAGAVETPLITLFGPTDIKKNRPLGKGRIKIIRKNIICSPCYKPYSGKIECQDPICLLNIEVDDVIKEAENLLK